MTTADIRSTAADFAEAARRAVAAGFAGVEVHAANGHLLHQFLAGNTNRRTDAYGGPVAHRIRFVLETVEAVVRAIGPHRVGIRLAPGSIFNGIEEGDETADLYRTLVAALPQDLAYVHIVFADPDDEVFRRIRKDWTGVLIANPILGWGVPLPADGGAAEAERLLAAGADLVSLGRAFIANPDLVARLRRGAPLNPLHDHGLMYGGGASGYTDYPALADA